MAVQSLSLKTVREKCDCGANVQIELLPFNSMLVNHFRFDSGAIAFMSTTLASSAFVPESDLDKLLFELGPSVFFFFWNTFILAPAVCNTATFPATIVIVKMTSAQLIWWICLHERASVPMWAQVLCPTNCSVARRSRRGELGSLFCSLFGASLFGSFFRCICL